MNSAANDKVISTQALIEKFREALDDKWGYIWGTAGETWTEAKQKKLEETTDADREKSREYGSKWIGHKVADCSGLFPGPLNSWADICTTAATRCGTNTARKKANFQTGSGRTARN